MNFSAEKSSRKWANDALGRGGAAMVTAIAALALWAAAGPAMARQARPASPLELFSIKPPRLRGSLHPVAIPLPRPRPADAPKAETDKAESDKPTPDEAAKAAESAPPPSACRLALTDAIAIA